MPRTLSRVHREPGHGKLVSLNRRNLSNGVCQTTRRRETTIRFLNVASSFRRSSQLRRCLRAVPPLTLLELTTVVHMKLAEQLENQMASLNGLMKLAEQLENQMASLNGLKAARTPTRNGSHPNGAAGNESWSIGERRTRVHQAQWDARQTGRVAPGYDLE
jgi:hypothetical protein